MTQDTVREPTDLTAYSDDVLAKLIDKGRELMEQRRLDRQEKARTTAWKILADAGLDREGKPIQVTKKGRPPKASAHAASGN